MLKLNWNGKECDGWVWDGKELKPKYGNSNNAFETNNAPIPVVAAKIIGLF